MVTKTKVELEDTIETLIGENRLLKEECSSYKQSIASFVGVKEHYESENKKLQMEYDNKIKALQENLEKERKSVNQKVNIQLASVGVKEFAMEEIEPMKQSTDEIVKQFNAMPSGLEKQEFYAKHKAVLNQSINLQTDSK